jgi:hypothetical protein
MYFIQSAQSGLSGWRKQSAAKLSLTQLNWFYVLFNIQLIIQSVQFSSERAERLEEAVSSKAPQDLNQTFSKSQQVREQRLPTTQPTTMETSKSFNISRSWGFYLRQLRLISELAQ